MKNSSIVLIAVAAAALAGVWLMLGRGDAPRPDLDGPAVTDDATDRPSGPAENAVGELTAPGETRRTAVSGGSEAPANDGDARAALAVTGRVIDAAGAPVAGAQVALFARRDPRALFEAGGRPESFQNVRTMLRAESAAPGATTDADGRYTLDGKAFTAAVLELAVTHDGFAPELVRQAWTLEAGRRVELEDIVLDGGARVRGRVVGPSGNAVPGARVRLQSMAGLDFGRGGGGGRGGGRGAGQLLRMMTQNVAEDDPTAALGGRVEADGNGYFTFEHVPPGALIVRAEAKRFVPAEKDDLEAKTGEELDVGDLQLTAGAAIHGRVSDIAGKPVADAEVSARASRENTAGVRFPGAEGMPGGQAARGLFRAMMGYEQTTRTDAEGLFELDMVPASPLRLTVSHPSYVDLEMEPVPPDAPQALELTVRERPSLVGVVLDRLTGEPVELYAIRARRAGGPLDGNPWNQGPRNADRQNQDPERAAEIEARLAERQAQRDREQAYREQRIGGSGMVPRRTEDPSHHAGGRFVLSDLQPGEYVVDVLAPGHVGVAAGRFTLSAEGPNAEIAIRLERGTVVRGRVTDARTGAPVADARLAIALPPLDGDSAQADRTAGGFGGFGGRRGGPGGGNDTVAEVRTEADGSYEFPPVLPGPFLLTIRAQNYPDQHDASFTVQASPASQRVDFAMDPGARVYGAVADLEPDNQVRLQFLHIDSQTRRTIDVDPATGEYEVLGLPAGGYLVQIQQRGRGRNDWRARVGGEIAARTGSDPDVFVPKGGEVRYDVGAAALEFGTVRGQVYRNGSPGDGLEVRLAPAEDTTVPADDPASRIRRGVSRLFSARVSADDGSFEITSIPPGQYLLEVHSRSGGGPRRNGPGAGNGALYSELIVVVRGAPPLDRVLEVTTGALSMSIADEAGNPVERARVSLALAAEVGNDSAPAEWRDAPSLQRLGVRAGQLDADNVPPGVYRYAVEARDFAPAVGDVVVAPGDNPNRPITVVLKPAEAGATEAR